MPKLAVFLVCLLSQVPGQQPSLDSLQRAGLEFPPQDAMLASLEYQGLLSKVVRRQVAEAPDSVETIRLVAQAQKLDELLVVLRAIVDRQPRRVADAFDAMGNAVWQFRGNDERMLRRRDTLRQIIADARLRFPDMPREEAARAARVFVGLDGELNSSPNAQNDHAVRLARFIEEYRGTEAALLAKVDAITYPPDRPRDRRAAAQEKLDALEAFARAHPGTAAGAKAVYFQGFEWHTINTLGVLEPRGADPIARFDRVLAIVKELESGRYPDCEWVRKASDLILGFFYTREGPIAPASLDRMIAAYEDYVRSRFSVQRVNSDQGGIGYVVTSKLADLYARKGERVAGVEGLLATLERGAADRDAVRYLRVLFYMKRPDTEAAADQATRLAKARAELTALSAGTGLYNRRALATLASLDFAERKYAEARGHFLKYATAFPASSWTWVALIRAGQSAEALGDPAAAVANYLAAAGTPELPLAQVLGDEYAARAYEAAGEFEKALAAHQRALDGWDSDFGFGLQRYSTYVRHSTRPGDPFVPRTDSAEVTRESLPVRIAQLKRSLAMPGGALLERGRTLLAQKRQGEAEAEFKKVVAQFPTSPAGSEATALAHLAQLEGALGLANVERPDADEAAAIKALDALAREPVDFAVTAARIARASLYWKIGDAAAAEQTMLTALDGWHAQQRVGTPASALEHDVADIRRTIFLPHGGDIYAGGRWNAFDWSNMSARFVVLNADLSVKAHNGDIVRVTLVQSLPIAEKALYFDSAQLRFLEQMTATLGGTRRREPTGIMQTPNQPVGDSIQILRLWNTFFPARPGHWGGWELETYPRITEIQFTNAERTKAAAKVTIGYSGATVELEKENGTWIARRLTSQWIT